MTYNYWIDAGRPTVQGDYAAANYAFENCANQYECSSRAIQNYMFRYQRVNISIIITCIQILSMIANVMRIVILNMTHNKYEDNVRENLQNVLQISLQLLIYHPYVKS